MLGKISRTIQAACRFLLAFSLTGVTLVLTANVILRYCFASGLAWAEELTQYMVAWATFVGAACCVSEGSDITIDSLVSLLPRGGRRVMSMLTVLVSMAFMAVFIYTSSLMTMRAYTNGQMATSMSLRMWTIYASMPVGGTLTMIRLFEKLLTLAKNKAGDKHDAGGDNR